MKIRPVGAVLFHADRQTDRRTERQICRSQKSLFEILRTCLKSGG